MGFVKSWSPNQLVAYNLIKARQLRGWTQEEAARQLSKYQGAEWSKVTWSAAERSVDGKRVRQFTADDLLAFSQAFDLPLTWWLLPPGSEEDVTIAGLEEVYDNGSRRQFEQAAMLRLLFYVPDEIKGRLAKTGLDQATTWLVRATPVEDLWEMAGALHKAADLLTGSLRVAEAGTTKAATKQGARRPGKGNR